MNSPQRAGQAAMIRDTAGQDRFVERPNVWKRHRGLGIVLLAAGAAMSTLLVYLLRYSEAGISVDRARLSVATVERGTFVHDLAADGQVVAAVSPTLYAAAPGSVTLKVHGGDSVTKAQLLAIIDSPDLAARLSQEQSTLEALQFDWQRAQLEAKRKLSQLHDALTQAQVDQNTAQRELERGRKAHELGAYSELQVLRAQDALEKAGFSLEQARANYAAQPGQNRFDVDSKKALLERQRYLVNDLTRQAEALQVRSPVDGQVGQVQVADRASVAKDVPLLTVIDLSALEVEIKVAEGLARDLKPGLRADLEADGHRWQGLLSGISPQVINGQVTARLRFSAGQPEGLRQSQRLSVRVLIDRREGVLMVDRGAFVDQDGGGFTYVVHGNVAERRPIRLGEASFSKVEILEGIAAGDQIVVAGTDAFNKAKRVILSH
jgi:HlyD family secretion protein